MNMVGMLITGFILGMSISSLFTRFIVKMVENENMCKNDAREEILLSMKYWSEDSIWKERNKEQEERNRERLATFNEKIKLRGGVL